MTTFPKEKEKRQYRRLPAISLSADLKIKKGLFTHWYSTSALDFNIYGVALVVPNEPTLGTKTKLKLSLTMDMAEVKVSQVEDAKKGEWRAGFIFSNQSKHSEETTKQLKRINDYLERNALLKEKLKEGE